MDCDIAYQLTLIMNEYLMQFENIALKNEPYEMRNNKLHEKICNMANDILGIITLENLGNERNRNLSRTYFTHHVYEDEYHDVKPIIVENKC